MHACIYVEHSAYLFARGGLVCVKGSMFQPVAIVQVVLVQQRGKGMEVSHALEAVLDKGGRRLVQRGHLFVDEQSVGAGGGGLFLERGHVAGRVLIRREVPGHVCVTWMGLLGGWGDMERRGDERRGSGTGRGRRGNASPVRGPRNRGLVTRGR